MYDMPNHKERRKIAKRLGLLKQRSNLPFKAYCAELQRAIDAGKEIHRQKTELMWRSVEEQEDAIESGSRNTNAPSINTKKEAIAKLFNAPNEKRSYSEISADVELQSWKKRFQS